MRVLLDECLPRKLKHELTGHQVATVPEMGWSGTKNGALLELAEPVFDVFVTIDRGLQYQQDLRETTLALVLLKAPNNRFETLRPLMPEVLLALETVRPGYVIQVPHLPDSDVS